jgi:hypothetical protein
MIRLRHHDALERAAQEIGALRSTMQRTLTLIMRHDEELAGPRLRQLMDAELDALVRRVTILDRCAAIRERARSALERAARARARCWPR